MTTPEQERVRLAAVYSAMSDNELLKIAHSGDEHKSTWTCHACGHEWTAPDGEPSGDAAAI